MADRHCEDLCTLVCVFQSCETSTSHSVCRSDFTSTPPSLSTFLVYYHSLPFLPSSCSPTQFLFGSGLFCCIFLDGLHDDHKCQRASAGLEMQTLPQRDVESSCCRHCCGINWWPGHLLVTQHRQIGFWILEWFEVARYCRRLLLSHCRGMSAAEAAPGCVCVSLVAAAEQRILPGRPERIHNHSQISSTNYCDQPATDDFTIIQLF